jgi:transcriptional regulator with XRE-family HTH domain
MTSEFAKAKEWRLAKGWSLADLADLTGYSVSSIVWFERGHTPRGTPIDVFSWYRYKRICQALDSGLDCSEFGWGIVSDEKFQW